LNFKIDENLPAECAALLRDAGFGAETVAEENLAGADDTAIARSAQAEDRVLITLDLDFANIQAYPPATHPGIIVLRMKRQDKYAVIGMVRSIVSVLKTRPPAGDLWIVEPDRIRFRAQ
jgi:predicted nuclease of predicted toxin-antitoxin system